MKNNEIIKLNTKTEKSGNNINGNGLKDIVNISTNVINNNTMDFKEIVQVAKEVLKHSDPSNEHYITLQRILDLCEIDYKNATTNEEKERIRQEIKKVHESLDKIQEDKMNTNQKVFESVNEVAKENRKINLELVKFVTGTALAFTGGFFIGAKGKDIVKFISKQ